MTCAGSKMDYTVYEPNKYVKMGIKVWPLMVRQLIEGRELLWRLFVRDWAVRYKQSALGYLWVILNPLIAVATFLLLNRAGILNVGKLDIPYPLYALIGLSVWQLFSGGLFSGCVSITAAGGMVSKINFPREVLVLSSVGQVLFEFLIKFALIGAFFFYFGFTPKWWGVVLFPLSIIPIFMFTLGLSFVFSLVTGIVRDTPSFLSLVTMLLMFLTPVVYPITGDKSLLFRLNPLFSLVNAPRDILIYGFVKEPADFFVVSVLSVLLFLISWRFFYLVESKIPERL